MHSCTYNNSRGQVRYKGYDLVCMRVCVAGKEVTGDTAH